MKRGFYSYTLLAAALLCLVGWWTRHTVRQKMQKDLEEDLRSILMADVTALEVWMEARLQTASFVASDPRLRAWVTELRHVALQPETTRETLVTNSVQTELRHHLSDVEQRIGFLGYNVFDKDGLILAARQSFLVGRKLRGPRVSNLSQLFRSGEPQLLIPLRDEFSNPFGRGGAGFRRGNPEPGRREFNPGGPPPGRGPPDAPGNVGPDRRPPIPGGKSGAEGPPPEPPAKPGSEPRAPPENEPVPKLMVMLSSPIKNAQGEVIAAIGFYLPTGEEFTRMLSAARFGASGETYAFNREAIMITRSRFDEQLKQLGLLPKDSASSSVLTLELLDPGGDLTQDFKTTVPRGQWALTTSAANALANSPGFEVEGHRDFRGVLVAEAWTWLPRFQIGIATKVDIAEAYQPLQALRNIFLVLILLLALCTAGFLFYSFLFTKLRRKVEEAELAMRELGQYRLEEKIGEGGMGVVYRAKHALLRRPTAIKLLLPQKASQATIGQFEKEVRLTSRLTHPNTIQIYDFGHTTDGIFYYAMEYLEGIDLRRLVGQAGALPSGRVIHILLQICGALEEAHRSGLVHRDIKPSNIFLTQRGGQADWVKVLDFGLVARSHGAEEREEGGFTDAWIAGTPGYMAPESLRSQAPADARADVYSVGALGYFLLSGRGPYDGLSTTAVREQYLKTDPAAQFNFAGWADGPLQRLVRACLESAPEKRPASMAELAEQLRACPEANTWTLTMSAEWWSHFSAAQGGFADKTRLVDPAAVERTIKIEFGQRLPRSQE